MIADYDTYQNTHFNIQPGTQTYTLSNEYPPGGCCTSQADVVVGALGPVSLEVYPAFSSSIAILPVIDRLQRFLVQAQVRNQTLQTAVLVLHLL